MKKWSADRWMSFAAIVASLGTLFVIVYQTTIFRKQQYASVLPYLEMWNSNPGREGNNYMFILKNNGIGPAFIKDVKIHFDDSIYSMDPGRFTTQIIQPKDSIDNFGYTNIRNGSVVPAGSLIELVAVKNDSINAPILRKWFQTSADLEVEITYESVYEEKWITRGSASQPIKLD